MKPAKSILDPTFKYVPSVKTNLRETFKRVRAEQAKPKVITKPQETKQCQ